MATKKKKTDEQEEGVWSEVLTERAGSADLIPGRIVHFVYHGEAQAAIVSKVLDNETQSVNLFVFIDARGLNFSGHHPNVRYSEGWEDGTWHWTDLPPIEETKEVEESSAG